MPSRCACAHKQERENSKAQGTGPKHEGESFIGSIYNHALKEFKEGERAHTEGTKGSGFKPSKCTHALKRKKEGTKRIVKA